ncbi:hypothetical protein [Methanosarcina horonobensis]|uniref:hypothetical protein n=1 Tax=Methanosarcina horonobensis TaxID=418008 RepID=UPI000AF5A2E6|nr:hypothetical protein [Methanosarcina horonobensis]
MDEKIAPHLEELTRALGDIDKTGIRAEFDKLLAFHVPPEVAKETILRKFGGKRKVLKVKDLSASLKNFEIIGRILDIGEKALRPQEGVQAGPSKLYTGVLADETGSVMFSSWKELPGSVGDVINIKNAIPASGRTGSGSLSESSLLYLKFLILPFPSSQNFPKPLQRN